jgi:arylsulfatase A-like enzyme
MRAARLALALVAATTLGCPSRAPKIVVYDLAERLAVAERWSARDVILFGTPAAEPHLASGFFREAGAPKGDRFTWAGREAELSIGFGSPLARSAVVDVAPYTGLKEQSADVFLNGAPLGRIVLNDARFRYALTLPAAAQKTGENRLRFVFARTASPSQSDAKNLDLRQLAAAFYSLTVAASDDRGLDDLLGRDAAHPFGLGADAGVPSVEGVGPAAMRFALRLPEDAELRFTPELHAAARAAAGAASFRVTLETESSPERELFSRVIAARDAGTKPAEVAVRLPGRPGEIARVSLLTGVAPADRFAWGVWRAPRVMGKAGAASLEATAYAPADDARADALRAGLGPVNVVFVILDAARAPQFGAYGYARPTTPEIDRIAKEGVVFETAATPAVYTLGAMSSVWTSQYPDRHHSEVSFSARLPKDRLTLAEVLSARGIATAGFVANAVAGTTFGFERGFAEFHEIYKDLGSGAAGFVKTVPPWVEKNKDKPFFLYLHFREPHFPYDPPAPFDTRFGPDGPIAKAARSDAAFFTDLNQGRRTPAAGEIEHLVRLYDGNLAYADEQLGLVRRALEAAGVWEKSVVIVAADHGEALFEHKWIGHNVQLYEESAHVPLIVRFPSGHGPAGQRVKGLADLLDVAPTVLDLFRARGQGGSDKSFEGRSLLPMVAGAPGKPAVLSRTVWDRPRYALRDASHKFLYDTRTGEEELFDLAADPGERTNVAAKDPLRAAYYRQALHHWTAGLASPSGRSETAILTREQCENMKALGYLDPKTPCPEN